MRKAFGGGMRQAGVLAAAALLALHDGPALLVADHARAQRLASGLARLPWLRIDVAATETNIVMADLVAGEPADLLAHLKAHGVLARRPARAGSVSCCTATSATTVWHAAWTHAHFAPASPPFSLVKGTCP